MQDIKKFIEEKNINVKELCDYLAISRTTLYVWLEEKRPEKLNEIITGINRMAEDKKIYIEGVTAEGSMIGDNRRGKVFSSKDPYLEKYVKLLEEKIAKLEEENERLKKLKK